MPFVSSTLKSFEKWRSPLFGATGNFNHQILPYGILFLPFISTNVFYILSFKFSRQLVQTMAFSFKMLPLGQRKTGLLRHVTSYYWIFQLLFFFILAIYICFICFDNRSGRTKQCHFHDCLEPMKRVYPAIMY